MADRWYVVAAQPGCEDTAEVHLKRQGFDVWMPRQVRSVRHARRRQEKRVPFFPGYMFVSMDVARQRWRSINGTRGVRSLIMQGEQPCRCPGGLVEGLRAATDEKGIFNGMLGIGPGDAVCVVSGALAQAEGTLVDLDDAGRARVLLRIMQGEVAVTLNARVLAPAGEPAALRA